MITNTTIKKLEKSTVEITSGIKAEAFASYEEKALARISERMEIPGFRKGKVPADIAKQNINEMALLEEMAEAAIYDAYPKILEENKIDAIGRPEISITKIAKGNDLEFTIKTAVLPEMKLPDYTKIAKEENAKAEYKEEIKIEEVNVDKVINDLRNMRAHQNMPAHEHEDGEEHKHEFSEEELPAVDDEFVKSFGKFENVEEFKNKIRENLKKEQEVIKSDKKRLAIIEAIIKETKGEIPDILINSETDKMMYKMEADMSGMGFKMDQYLQQIGKTEVELRHEWKPEAEKRAKLQMIVHTISEKENIKPTKEEVEKEAEQITKMYKDADPIRAQAYVETMLTNEKVFAFLESK
jgi:trigger factor